ncbi:zinc-binding alcohol dehydrogenase family protein [Aspergillus mulundensis]|uniref:Dehydrogenase orsE n=1 Tax=Aspergillus mulundensis TaxID=1810919 RepID=A0A3D8T2A1_9EURO|nr:Dehydrogenase orsE [Aspergillus mulundensis]RDW92683.1 Dehydrogenase orsE [Aspergillus mulundensis]
MANQAAWLNKAGTDLEVGDAPIPTAGPGEIVVKNAAVAINPLDTHMQDTGAFVKQWPTVLGCDVAGTVHETGPDVQRFKKGDRVIGHAINLVTGRPQDGAYALYTVVPADKAAILPDSISFTDGVVVPVALEAAVCALCVKEPREAMPGISTPAPGLPYPSLDKSEPLGKTLVVYGGSSSVGSMTTQIATAIGLNVIAVSGAHNFDLSKRCGATQVIDRKDPAVIDKVVAAVEASGNEFMGIFDAISTPETYGNDAAILQKLGRGAIVVVHPPPEGVPSHVRVGLLFAVNDIATPIWNDFVTPALESGRIQCLPPPTVVGKGLEAINEGLRKCKAGVSGTKLVVEL